LFFWQPSEEIEEEVVSGRIKYMGDTIKSLPKHRLTLMRVDTIFGMFFSNIVMFFIIVTAASTLGAAGIRHIDTAAQAAQGLRPLAGDFAFLLFTGGIIGTGLLSLPVLAGSSAYAVSEGLGWKRGLYNTFSEARGFYGVITLCTLLGLLVNFLPISPFALLYYTAVLNGLIAPALLVMILLITNNAKIMKKFTNGLLSNTLGIVITILMTLCGLALIASWIF
jgi:Mn2+/Fe2+ NRAMP family transporter